MTKKNELSVDELTKEVSRLKSQIGGYKKANDMYRKKIEKLERLVKHNREVDVEGDHMYEEKLAELEKTKKELGDVSLRIAAYKSSIETKDGVIESLQQKCSSLVATNKELENHVNSLTDALAETEATVEELRMPWWKKLF